MHVIVVVNPVAGAGRAPHRAQRLVDALRAVGIAPRMVLTTLQQTAELHEAIRGADVVLAVGGDGTLNRVAATVLEFPADTARPIVGVLPCGTGNVAVRAFGLPSDVHTVASLVRARSARSIDVGLVLRDDALSAVFLLWAGVGIDATLLETVAARRAPYRGWKLLREYVLEALRMAFRYDFPRIDVASDQVTGRFAAVAVANVGRLVYGAITRSAAPADGMLNVIATEARGRPAWLLAFALYAARQYDRCRGVARAVATHVSLRSPDRVAIHVDGEPAGTLPVVIRIAPAALSLLAPPTLADE